MWEPWSLGKLADVVLWRPRSFGIKPNLVIKGGMPAWGALGDGNATVEGAEPRVYGPLLAEEVTALVLSQLRLFRRLRLTLDYKNVYMVIVTSTCAKYAHSRQKGHAIQRCNTSGACSSSYV